MKLFSRRQNGIFTILFAAGCVWQQSAQAAQMFHRYTTTGPWRAMTDPSGQRLPSYVTGGSVKETEASYAGERTATWVARGLKPGRYRVELFYRKHPGNARCARLFFGPGQVNVFTLNRAFDQTTGREIPGVASPGGFTSAYADVTPVPNGITVPKPASGELGVMSIRIADTRCQGGRLVADAVRLTWLGSSDESDTDIDTDTEE